MSKIKPGDKVQHTYGTVTSGPWYVVEVYSSGAALVARQSGDGTQYGKIKTLINRLALMPVKGAK